MDKLSIEQKKYLIKMAKENYLSAFKVRLVNDPWLATQKEEKYLLDSCHNISSLIYYIAKKKYNISDTHNEIIECIFTDEDFHTHHFINRIYGEFIDASIEQFNYRISQPKYSPYDDNCKYYNEITVSKPLNESAIEYEMDFYYSKSRFESKKENEQTKERKSIFQKILDKVK